MLTQQEDSPDTKAEKLHIANYTPSDEPASVQAFFGRRRLRINNGQDPNINPNKFTPPEDQRMKWPTDEEAYAWAEAGKENHRKRPSSCTTST